MTLKEAFSFYGVKARDPRKSWSARSEDTVVITLWTDEVTDDGTTIRIDAFGHERPGDWQDSFGNKERLENLRYARDHCDGLFRAIMITAKDPSAKKREIGKVAPPDPDLVMKLVALDKKTGKFSAESVRRGKPQRP